ncbi:hypothetical protein [Gordonia sp. 'Campus']|uniref:hypothetical protein n=1 Tax=Gordonia sp. 'Campus' TaxID=2915824 RepID=UPI001EE498ED|nr:hypothetical protein [Gordonia sp. 'Campus']
MTKTITTDTETDADENSASADTETATAASGDSAADRAEPTKRGRLSTASVSLRSILIGAVAVLVVGAMALLGWQWSSASSEVDRLNAAAADDAAAEKVALDYATGAADMSFENPDEWRTLLTKGTSPELSERLRRASTQMEQLLRPLQWSSTAQPIAAKVESVDGNTYQVVAFVNVQTKNVQAPSGIESTATYRVTMDKSQNWLITAISSTGSNLDADNPGAPAGEQPVPGNPPAEQPAPADPPVPGN